MNKLRTITALVFSLSLVACSGEDKKKPVMETRTEVPAEPSGKVVKTDEEWKKILTPEFKHQGKGTYHCAGCNALLFSSDHKFDSGCGWPSFYDPAKAENVTLKKDTSMGVTRTEVVCSSCGGHLGHVFTGEGYKTPTDQRYCINGGGLVYVPAKEKEEPVKK